MRERRGQFVIIAVLMIAIMIMSISALMHRAVTYYRHEPWEEYLALIGNIELNSHRLVELSLANYTNPIKVNNTETFVDNNTSDVDGNGDKGTHGNFPAQQHADSFYDTLTESGVPLTTILKKPSATSGSWSDPTNAYDDDTNWARSTNSGQQQVYSGFGFNISSEATIAQVRVRLDVKAEKDDEIKLEISNNGGASYLSTTYTSPDLTTTEQTIWVNVTTWDSWTPEKLNNDNIWARVTQVKSGSQDTTFLDWIAIEVMYYVSYRLDLEIQWTAIDYDELDEYLCIRTGSVNWGSEDLRVDVWNAASNNWDTVINRLTPNSWNNVSISSYLTSSTLTIRFKDGAELNDPNQDSWDVECSLIHVWSIEFNKNILKDNLEKWQTDISRIYVGRGISFNYELANGLHNAFGTPVNYYLGLNHTWWEPTAFSAANATLKINVGYIGLQGYEFNSAVFLKMMNVSKLSYNSQEKTLMINITITKENNNPVKISRDNFEISKFGFNYTRVYITSGFDSIYGPIYTIKFEEVTIQTSREVQIDIQICDERSVKVIARYKGKV
jgi:hypothetical protein